MAKCLICNGTGWVRLDVPPGHPQFGKAVQCECLKGKLEQRKAEQLRATCNIDDAELRRWTFASFKPELCVPQRGKGRKPEYLQEQKRVQRLMRTIKEQCQTYAENPEGWLVLYGPVGSGKTHLAYAVAGHQIQKGQGVYANTAPELLDALRNGYRDTTFDFSKRFQIMMEVRLLVIDDLGTQSGTAWAVEKLYELINHRYRTDSPLVVTTNVELQNPKGAIDARILSRLMEGSRTQEHRVIRLPAGDLRPYLEKKR